MKTYNFNAQSYIHQASSFYDGLVNGELNSYSSIVFACLHDKFDIRTIDEVKILDAVVRSKMYSNHVYLSETIDTLPLDVLVSNIGTYITSCDEEDNERKTQEFEYINIEATFNTLNPNLASIL